MTKFAAYDDLAIYAIGDTAEQAEANACQDAGDPQATFKVAPISDDFAARIAEYGWNGKRQTFEISKRDGHLVETTN